MRPATQFSSQLFLFFIRSSKRCRISPAGVSDIRVAISSKLPLSHAPSTSRIVAFSSGVFVEMLRVFNPLLAVWRRLTVSKYHSAVRLRPSCRIERAQQALSNRFFRVFSDSSGIQIRIRLAIPVSRAAFAAFVTGPSFWLPLITIQSPPVHIHHQSGSTSYY